MSRHYILKGASPRLPQRVVRVRKHLIGIWNCNIENSTSDHARRVFNVARKVAESDSARGKVGDLFAFQEAHYEKHTQWHPPWCTELESKRITCPESGASRWTAECFFSTWRSHLSASLAAMIGSPIHMQHGDCAVLSNSRFIIASAGHVSTTIGRLCSFGENQRFIIGARFRLKATGSILPFYSVHVVPKSGGRNQIKQCIDIAWIVRRNFQAGDLTPLVVGDFNFSRIGDPNHAYDTMDQYFYEVGHFFGESVIEHCWVGRESAFPNAGGFLEPVAGSYEPNREFNDRGANLTDHACPYVEFELL